MGAGASGNGAGEERGSSGRGIRAGFKGEEGATAPGRAGGHAAGARGGRRGAGRTGLERRRRGSGPAGQVARKPEIFFFLLKLGCYSSRLVFSLDIMSCFSAKKSFAGESGLGIDISLIKCGGNPYSA